MNMYHHLCVGQRILSSNLPEKYESLALSCEVESESFLFEPNNVTIHHGKIFQGEAEIYLISDNNDISNEVFKTYQTAFISIMPSLISSGEAASHARFILHEFSHLLGEISMDCYRLEKLCGEEQESKQVEENPRNRRILAESKKAIFLMKTYIRDYYLLRYGRGCLHFREIDVQRLLFSTFSSLNIKANISCLPQQIIRHDPDAISSILTKILYPVHSWSPSLTEHSLIIVSANNKDQCIEILIEMNVTNHAVGIYNAILNEHSQLEHPRFSRPYDDMLIDSMRKLIKIIQGEFQVKLLDQTVSPKSENFVRCQITFTLPKFEKFIYDEKIPIP